jgi:hypothetical protein
MQFRDNKYDYTYTLNQPEARDYLNIPEEVLKYVYDGYTFAMGMQPIRKPKTRKKVQQEFHSAGHNKSEATKLVDRLVTYTKLLN